MVCRGLGQRGILNIATTVVDIVVSCWVAHRLMNPQVRLLDISLMWLLQMGLQFQFGILADRAFANAGKLMSRNVFSTVVFMVLLEAVAFPLSITHRVFQWPKDELRKPVDEPELTNLHFIADYFGLGMAGFNVAIA